mgnify:CR=1 FL=1
MKEFTIGRNDAGQRLDRFLAKAVPLLPASLAQKYIRIKRIKCNGKRIDRDTRLQEGDTLQLYINDEFFDKPREDNAYLTVANPKLNIVYEDENILLVDKRPGLAVHPHDGAEYGRTLIDHIQSYLYQKREWRPREENAFTPALCNRIDRNTGGIVIAAIYMAGSFGIGAAICASIGFVFCFLHYYWTEERNVADTPKEEAANVKFTDILSVFKKNRAFLALCIHGVCICCMQYVGSTLGTYMYSDVLGNIGIMSLASVVSMPLSIVALLIMPKLAEKFGLEKVIRTCLLIGCGLYMGLFAVMMLFSVPAIVYLVWSTMASGIASVSILMQWGLVGEAIDYNELLTGKRTEGSIYGTFNLSRRIGQTVGNSAAVLALGWIGYDANLAAQSAGTLTGIKALCVLVPGIFLVGSWIAFRFVWNITPEIRAKMAASKAAKSAQ